ncbi:cyclin N-terminal domain-containing protein 1 isoform X4 [Pan paniscus]|uniref:cyclin N-terminal domain-containing protein 1 isoform X4 n=1 Tax=Pan paniscus TaxID=9597 RepID=UPI0024370C54|nr:cyclin N-terminal domain-containing protein 1 isoform X4 [Pan paniscus]
MLPLLPSRCRRAGLAGNSSPWPLQWTLGVVVRVPFAGQSRGSRAQGMDAGEFVFLLSEQWCLEKSVSYQAVEILERFMVKQAENICRQATIQPRDNKRESQNWRALKQQLVNKFTLRLVSCVQLASKLSFRNKIISNITVLNFLQALGYLHTKEELLESELDVLKSLNFQINLPTPLAYVETLLEVLGYNGCLVPAMRLHATCLTLLDLVYLLHEPIYESLLRASIENSTPSQLQGEKFTSVKEDFMLLAVGIIAASAFIQNHECWSQVCTTEQDQHGCGAFAEHHWYCLGKHC